MASQSQFIPPQSGFQSQNIWQKALETLDDDLKAHLNFDNSTKRDIFAAAFRAADEKKQLCLKKRWKLKKPGGEEVILRDVLEKIIAWLNKFKTIGDVAMQYDPSHVSLPWAGVRFFALGGFVGSLLSPTRR